MSSTTPTPGSESVIGDAQPSGLRPGEAVDEREQARVTAKRSGYVVVCSAISLALAHVHGWWRPQQLWRSAR